MVSVHSSACQQNLFTSFIKKDNLPTVQCAGAVLDYYPRSVAARATHERIESKAFIQFATLFPLDRTVRQREGEQK